jgi:TatA/E family protein of Tat protein translocase
MPFGLGFGETLLIFAIILIFFGPRKLPEMGASLGKGIRDFKRALNGVAAELQNPVDGMNGIGPAGTPAARPRTALEPPETAVPVEATFTAAPAPDAVAHATGEPARPDHAHAPDGTLLHVPHDADATLLDTPRSAGAPQHD